MAQPKGRPTNAFARFRALTKRVVSVPKAEIDKRDARHREARERIKRGTKSE